MKIAVLLFTYHRSYHTEKVLTALRDNTIQLQKLLVFQDGLKQDEDDSEWRKVNKLIQGIDWCDKEVIVSDFNKGLADSIVSGVDYAFKKYDAVIVLEDDCVASPSFMQFMVQGLIKYEDIKKVYSVSGFSWPIKLGKSCYDAYSCGRFSSWGWGTWKDRWADFKKDVNTLKHLKADQHGSKNLLTWGNDLEAMLVGTITGQYDSWGVYWALNIIENDGICINPYISLINHIGWDDTGTNTYLEDAFDIVTSNDRVNEFVFPDDITILDSTIEAFAELHGSYTAVSHEKNFKENVLVYGLGNFFREYEKDINYDFNIVAFIDQKKKGWYAGKRILKPEDVEHYDYDKIIIMVQSVQECIKIINNLIDNGIGYTSIMLGHSMYGTYSGIIDEKSVTCDGKILLQFDSVSIKVESQDEFNNVCEVFVNQEYRYFINNLRRDIVIDVGINIGDSSIYFAWQEKVDKVYGYEPFKKTFMRAKDNLRQYIDANRVSVFQYGISNENAIRLIGFNEDMTCAQSTLETVREYAYDRYRRWGLIQEKNEQFEQIEVRKASEVFEPIFKEYPYHNIILKMDCEGEEYGIIKELSEKGLLSCISFIMLEWHYKGKDCLLSWLKSSGFSYWCNDKSKDMGLIYAFNASIFSNRQGKEMNEKKKC